jgi:hypothetical protein
VLTLKNKKRKKPILIVVILILVVGAGYLVYHIYSQHQKNVAWTAITKYINHQGISNEKIDVSVFSKELDGKYHRYIHVKDEKPNIAYEYFYRADKKKVFFNAMEVSSKSIHKHEFGGAGLSESEMKKIKYPPLKNSF